MKKIIATIMALCMVSSSAFVYAQDDVSETPDTTAQTEETANSGNVQEEEIAEAEQISAESETAEPVVYTLSLEDAIAMAYENNPQIEANQYDQKAKEIALDSAILAKQNYRYTEKKAKDFGASVNYGVISGFETHCLKNGYYVDAATVQYDLSRMEADKISGSIAYNVTEGYYNYVLMQKLVTAAENSLEMAEANKAVVDSQYELGLVAKLDYENAGLTVTIAKNALESYRLNMSVAEENLKILIHKDNENCKIITSDDVDCSDFVSDMTADIQGAMESRYDLTALKKSKELAYKYLDLAEIGTSASSLYNTAYSSYINAEYNYTNTQKLIALLIRSAYNSICTSNADMETARQSYEMKQKEYESGKIKYELGMITNLQLTQIINELYEAQVNYANAKITYRLAVEKYKYEITIGL